MVNPVLASQMIEDQTNSRKVEISSSFEEEHFHEIISTEFVTITELACFFTVTDRITEIRIHECKPEIIRQTEKEITTNTVTTTFTQTCKDYEWEYYWVTDSNY